MVEQILVFLLIITIIMLMLPFIITCGLSSAFFGFTVKSSNYGDYLLNEIDVGLLEVETWTVQFFDVLGTDIEEGWKDFANIIDQGWKKAIGEIETEWKTYFDEIKSVWSETIGGIEKEWHSIASDF